MSTPTPQPSANAPLDPAVVLAEVDAVLVQPVGELAEQADALDLVHQRLAAALSTLDRV